MTDAHIAAALVAAPFLTLSLVWLIGEAVLARAAARGCNTEHK